MLEHASGCDSNLATAKGSVESDQLLDYGPYWHAQLAAITGAFLHRSNKADQDRKMGIVRSGNFIDQCAPACGVVVPVAAVMTVWVAQTVSSVLLCVGFALVMSWDLTGLKQVFPLEVPPTGWNNFRRSLNHYSSEPRAGLGSGAQRLAIRFQ